MVFAITWIQNTMPEGIVFTFYRAHHGPTCFVSRMYRFTAPLVIYRLPDTLLTDSVDVSHTRESSAGVLNVLA